MRTPLSSAIERLMNKHGRAEVIHEIARYCDERATRAELINCTTGRLFWRTMAGKFSVLAAQITIAGQSHNE
jgi:hypothetical protein